MKTHAQAFQLVAAVMLAILAGGPVHGQPTNPPPTGPIDPATGLPRAVARALTPDGYLRPQSPEEIFSNMSNVPLNPPPLLDDPAAPPLQARSLIAAGQYGQALQGLLGWHARMSAATNYSLRLEPILPAWVELGGKYPKARQALIDVQYRDTRDFALGRGSVELFQELYDLNEALGQGEETLALFKDIRQNQPQLADGCYGIMEPALVARGEYQLCLDCLGNPETRFMIHCATFKQQHAFFESEVELRREGWAKMDELDRQAGRPPQPFSPRINTGKMGLRLNANIFVNDTRDLIEILVGTGHQEMAEKIRSDAVALLDDPLLQSAVSDAVARVQKNSLPAGDAPK